MNSGNGCLLEEAFVSFNKIPVRGLDKPFPPMRWPRLEITPLSPLTASPRISRRNDEKLRRETRGSVTTEEMAAPVLLMQKSGADARGHKLFLRYFEETVLLTSSIKQLFFESFSHVPLSLVPYPFFVCIFPYSLE